MIFPNVKYVFSLVCAVVALAGNSSPAGDWPMWRYNSYRSADSPDELPDRLQLLWIRQYTQRRQVWDDPLNHDLMPYDKVFEPVILRLTHRPVQEGATKDAPQVMFTVAAEGNCVDARLKLTR